MFWQMTIIEQKKLSKRAMFWIILAIIVATVLLAFGGIFGVKQAIDAGPDNADNGFPGLQIEGESGDDVIPILTWPMSFTLPLEIVSGLGGFILIVVTSAIMAQEYSWRSLQLWLGRGVPRPIIILAKFLIMIAFALLLVVTAVLLGGIISAGFSQSYLDTIPVDQVNWSQLALGALVIAYTLLPYAALALLLAVASRSTMVAIGAGLAYITLLEPIAAQIFIFLGGRWATIVQYMPVGLIRSLKQVTAQIATSASAAPVASNGPAPGTAALLLGVYILVLVGTAVAIFQRQDLGG